MLGVWFHNIIIIPNNYNIMRFVAFYDFPPSLFQLICPREQGSIIELRAISLLQLSLGKLIRTRNS